MYSGGGITVLANEVQEYELDTMVVTATRTMKQIQEVPSSVSVVTAKDIEERNITSVPEALQTLPGVYKSQAIQGGIQLRGFGSGDILVLVDGLQMNYPFNSTVDWEMIPVENIERIEVVRGAGSSLYGGHAVGGVVNIITKDAKKKGLNANIVLNYGSNNTWKKALYADVKANEAEITAVLENAEAHARLIAAKKGLNQTETDELINKVKLAIANKSEAQELDTITKKLNEGAISLANFGS